MRFKNLLPGSEEGCLPDRPATEPRQEVANTLPGSPLLAWGGLSGAETRLGLDSN